MHRFIHGRCDTVPFSALYMEAPEKNSFYSPNHASCDMFRISTADDHPRFQPNMK